MGLVGLVGIAFTLGLSSINWGFRDGGPVFWGLGGTLPLVLVFAVLLRVSWSPVRNLMEMLRDTLGALFRRSRPVDILAVSAMAGWGEELLFRGFLYGWMRGWGGVEVALVLSSILFGLAHFLSPAYAAFAFLAGIYFGLLYEWSGSLLAPILAHGLYDFIAISYYLYRGRGEA